MLNVGSSALCALAAWAWATLVLSSASWASVTSVLRVTMASSAFAISDGKFSLVCWMLAIVKGGRSLGECLRWRWKGEYPVDALMVDMMLNLKHGRAFSHPVCHWSTKYRRVWFIVLLVRLLAPSVCGWYAVDIFSFTPVRQCSDFQNFPVNHLSLSNTMFSGKPFSQYQWLKKRFAISDAFIFMRHGTSRISVWCTNLAR